MGLNSSLTLLPEHLQRLGYSTHMVGKWHLGFCHPDYLPTRRGFQSHLGQWTKVTDYYTRLTRDNGNPAAQGYDWHDGEEVSHLGEGEWSTEVLSR